MLIGKKEGWDNKSENRRPGEWKEEKTLELRHRDTGMEQIRTKQMMKQEKEESRNEGGSEEQSLETKQTMGDQKNGRRRKHWNWGTEKRTKQIMKEKEVEMKDLKNRVWKQSKHRTM